MPRRVDASGREQRRVFRRKYHPGNLSPGGHTPSCESNGEYFGGSMSLRLGCAVLTYAAYILVVPGRVVGTRYTIRGCCEGTGMTGLNSLMVQGNADTVNGSVLGPTVVLPSGARTVCSLRCYGSSPCPGSRNRRRVVPAGYQSALLLLRRLHGRILLGLARLGLCQILVAQGFYCGLYLIFGFHGD